MIPKPLAHASATAGVAIAILAISTAAQAERSRTLLDSGWKFYRESTPSYTDTPPGMPVTGWRFMIDPNGAADSALDTLPVPDTSGAAWASAGIGQDIFHRAKGFALVSTTVPAGAQAPTGIHFEGVDDNAAVFLNGKHIARHEGYSEPFDAPVAGVWRANAPNNITVIVENTAGAGGILQPVTLTVPGRVIVAAPAEAQPQFDDRAWRTVHLPHDYVIEGRFDPHGNASHGALPTPTAWYRRSLTIPAADRSKTLWIDFDGVYRNAHVWLNGKPLGRHIGGYNGFRFDITSLAIFGGRNVLAVHVDPTHPEGWWYEGGGIYRHVWLNAADPLHIAPDGTFVTARVTGETSAAPSADLKVQTTLANDSPTDKSCTVTYTLIRPDGAIAAATSARPTVPARSSVTISPQMAEPRALLWSLETPRLYHVRTVVSLNGIVVDSTVTPFGIRTVRFDPATGFYLNGKPVKIKGFCNHQDFIGVGIGMPDNLLDWRVKRLKEMGANAYRTSHNEVASALLDACDRQGMLVMDENREFGDTYAGKAPKGTQADDLSDLKQMIVRDRNHPSIILWSLCNEEFPTQVTPDGERIGNAMKTVVNALDGTRPITAAQTSHGAGLTLVTDVEGFNYNISGYDGFHKSHPDKPMIGSETSSEVQTRGIYARDNEKGYVSSYDVFHPGWAQTTEDAWEAIATRPFVAGGFVWTGFDYKGEPTPFGWPCINSHFGNIDMCGFPKDSYYYYQAWYGDRPIVHLFPHWNWPGKEGQPISVWAYSNADRVELFLNGKSLGAQEMPKYRHVEWSVPYTPGTLVAKAYKDGALTATDTVETTGAPAALRVVPSATTLRANGEDLSMVEVDIVDAQGRIVPTADNLVTFKVSGAGHIAGVGNGDPSSHEPDQASERHAFNGRCMALVQSEDGKPGAIQLSAQSAALTGASLAVQSEISR